MQIKQSNDQKISERFKAYWEKSYSEGHQIEVLVMLYHSVSASMNITFNGIAKGLRFVMSRTDKEFEPLKNEHYGIKDYHFRTLAHMLLQMGIYSKDLHDDLIRLNDFRNEIMHRFFSGKLTKSKFDKYYQLGIKLHDQTLSISVKFPEKFANSIRLLSGQSSLLGNLLAQVEQEKRRA